MSYSTNNVRTYSLQNNSSCSTATPIPGPSHLSSSFTGEQSQVSNESCFLLKYIK